MAMLRFCLCTILDSQFLGDIPDGDSSMTSFRAAIAALAVSLFSAATTHSQQLVQTPRADGATTPLRVYAANVQGCAPLVLISPGAGGSEDGYKYLADGMQAAGWRAIVMGHKESGRAALMGDIRQKHGIKRGLHELVDDPKAYDARLIDITAALKWANGTCKAPYIVLIGHSMGARTVMVEAGARLKLDVKGAGQDRFDAYVALSPDGPDPMFPEHAWSGIKKPMLVMTGTRDNSMQTGDYKSRTIPYDDLPPGCKWLGVIDGATHMNFAGVGFAGATQKLTLLEVKAFLNGLRTGKCGTPVPASGISLQSK
jgi:predicted dienelactone hydrolase